VSLLAPGPVKSAIMDEQAPAPTADFMDMLRGMNDENGMSPAKLAEIVFCAVERGDYWIFPHPEMLDAPLRSRTEMIVERRSPTGSDLIASEPDVEREQNG